MVQKINLRTDTVKRETVITGQETIATAVKIDITTMDTLQGSIDSGLEEAMGGTTRVDLEADRGTPAIETRAMSKDKTTIMITGTNSMGEKVCYLIYV